MYDRISNQCASRVYEHYSQALDKLENEILSIHSRLSSSPSQAVERELSRLDAAMGPVGSLADFVDNLGKENRMLRPLVDNATDHANKLEAQAEFLDRFVLPVMVSLK